jgi:hypothetical protein
MPKFPKKQVGFKFEYSGEKDLTMGTGRMEIAWALDISIRQ